MPPSGKTKKIAIYVDGSKSVLVLVVSLHESSTGGGAPPTPAETCC